MKVLLTGGNSGLGMLATLSLLKYGHSVAVSMRNPETKNNQCAERLTQHGAHVIKMDVTDESSVTSGVDQTLVKLDGIDVVINNSGVFSMGPLEAFTSQDWLRIFDVNVLGAQRINRAVLPSMRKKNFGILIHISSLLGRLTMPYCAPYCASKQALEALAEGYRRECAQFGIDSIIIEPGGFASSFFESAQLPSDHFRLESLDKNFAQSKALWDQYKSKLRNNNIYNPQHVADVIVNLLDMPHGQRPLRTVVDVMGLGESVNNFNQETERFNEEFFSNMKLDFDVTIKS